MSRGLGDVYKRQEAYAQSVAFTTDYCGEAINNFLEKRPLEFDWDKMAKAAKIED